MTLVLLLALAVPPGATAQAPADPFPFAGTWKLNPARSTLPPGAPRSVVSHIAFDGNWLTVREEIVDSDGKEHTATVKAAFDGKDYPVIGAPPADAVSYQRIDVRTIKGTSKKDGKSLMQETVTISPDGQTMTAVYTGPPDAQGKTATGTAVFERVR